MKPINGNEIREILTGLGVEEQRRIHSEKIATSTTINGCEMARELSQIIDTAVRAVLSEMELPKETTVVAVGANGREETTVSSDLDVICYVPQVTNYEGSFTDPYRKTMWGLYAALGLAGDPTIWVPGDFRSDDLHNIASMNLDARLIFGGDILTMDEIQSRVRTVCKPIIVASRHELELEKFGYKGTETGRNEYSVDFDIKKDRGGLRHLQHILWFIAAVENTSLQNLYKTVKTENPEVYAALDLMLHIRSWLHLKKKNNDTKIDLLEGSLWPLLREQFGENIIKQINDARVSIISYERTRILKEKKKGMKIGDGTLYGIMGLEIDNESGEDKQKLIVQLLRNAQATGLQISPLQFNELENEAQNDVLRPDENWAILFQDGGKTSTTLRRLIRFGIVEQIFPKFNVLKNKPYPRTHRHSQTTRLGRVIERLENFERITDNDLKDIYGGLTSQEQTGIRIALICRDIPTHAEISKRDYFYNLSKLYPSLKEATEIAERLIKRHRILFDCSLIDDCNDPREIEREATEIGTMALLDAQLIYTCAMLDYGKTEYYTKYQWDKTFNLYYLLKEELEGITTEKRQEYAKKNLEKKLLLSPEQIEILKSAPQSFLHSRYMTASDSLIKTMRCLETVQTKQEPQITIMRLTDDSIRIIVSVKYNNELPAIIAGTCLDNKISIDDAEIHIFGTETQLSVLFLEAHFNIPGLTHLGKENRAQQLVADINKNILSGETIKQDPYAILEQSVPQYILEETKKTGNYKFMVRAEKNTPGFLYAMMKILAELDIRILSTSVYTHPRNHGNDPLIEDIFILGPGNIEALRSLLKC